MVSTITSSTVSIMTSATQAGSVALVGILVLLSLLIQKEISSARVGPYDRVWGKALNLAIAPLLVAFILVVITRVADILR
jgi:uncharacterized membrane protein required for colicin V production